MKLRIALLLSATLTISALAQQKRDVTLDDIFKNGAFSQKSVFGINWMKNGRFYTTLSNNRSLNASFVISYDITTGLPKDTLVDSRDLKIDGQSIGIDAYSLSADEKKILIASQQEAIYRRSRKAYNYIYDISSKSLKALAKGAKQSNATFSPDGSKIAFNRENNLYYYDLEKNKEVAVATDGEWNTIINGSTDWVYEEEFSLTRAFFWSPDGSNIAYCKFNESGVKEYNMQLWGELYPEDYKFKYPKAGEDNSSVQVFIYNLDNSTQKEIDLGSDKDIYIPRMQWTADANVLSLVKLNRLQNKMELIHVNAQSGESKVILTEESDTYVDIDYTDDLTYLSDNKSFIKSTEKDGYKHIYQYGLDGKLIRQITSGEWEVTNFIGVDEKKKLVYFVSAEDSPLERYLYSIRLNGKSKKKLTTSQGSHNINFSRDFSYFIDYYSAASKPMRVSLHKAPSGQEVKVLEDNQELADRLETFRLGSKEYFSFDNKEGTSLNGYMIKPADFDASKKYPVLMYVYGGPGSQLVMNRWGGTREAWYHHLASQGYLIVCIDNRGTGGRGRSFKHITYGQMGKYEVADQIAGAKYLADLSYVDASRIGIWGWSYGGYMSSLSMFLGEGLFKSAIAVAPVSSWRFYDTIYTERYLKRPQDNEGGYDDYSPLSHVDKLDGAYLLIHGTGDDNVHFQNSVALQNALIAADKQFQSFYYPNRNHGIYGGNTTYHLYSMMTNFIKNNL